MTIEELVCLEIAEAIAEVVQEGKSLEDGINQGKEYFERRIEND